MIKKSKLILSTAMLALLFSGCGGMGPAEEKPKSNVTERIPTLDELTIDAPDPTDTNLEKSFNDILNNPDWGIKNKAAISYNSDTGVYTFDARYQTGCLKRKITLSENKRITFFIQPYIYEPYDGCLQFLIDDKVISEYTAENTTWNYEQFELQAGTHIIEWRRWDKIENYTVFGTSSITPYVSLKDFAFKDSLTALTSLKQTFDDTLNSEMWTGTGLTANIIDRDPIFAKWPQYGDALVDTHGKVYQLACAKGEGDNIITGNSSLTIQKITVTEESALSFDYKCDLLDWTDNNGILHQNYLKVYLDYAKNPAFTAIGYGQMWQKASIILPAGTHTVKFVCGTDDNWYGNRMTNSTFLDNITLTANSIASVDIYPKGLQETYVNGDSIQFTAKALRSDGSVIPDMNVSWTSSGGSIDAKGLFTPGTSKGTFTVTASIAGKSASNQTVKVHGSDYLTEPVTINGHTFTGKITPIDNTARSNTANITWADPTPAYSNFTTDGFFVLKGTAANEKYVLATIVKLDDDDTTNLEYNTDYPYITQYLMKPGDFEQRIWLRYGDGNYDVYIYEEKVEKCPDYGVYEGAFLNWHPTNEKDSQTFFRVKNQTGLNWSADDSAFLMPSSNIQSDNFLVSNAFNAVMAELPPDATLGQKLQALYDWEARRSHYDYVSFSNNQSTNKRKKQDAVSVLKYEMAVCEGYADLYTAFARLLGVKAAFQGSQYFNHAWTELYYNGQWKMVDITWDDPSPEGSTEKNPTAENYSYFLIDPADASHIPEGKDSPDKKIDYSRTISVSSQKEFASSSY